MITIFFKVKWPLASSGYSFLLYLIFLLLVFALIFIIICFIRAKNHPKLYLWSKPWEKLPLPEERIKEEDKKEIKIESSVKTEPNSDSVLMSILKTPKEEEQNILNNLTAPKIPQPEAAIDSNVCRVNLLEHIAHAQSLVEERLDDFEKQIDQLEDSSFYESDEEYPKTRQTINMLLRDLNTLHEFSQLTTL